MTKHIRGALVLFAVVLGVPAGASAQGGGEVGTIVIAHGASDEWNARVEKVAGLAKTGGPIEVAYLMGPAAATHRFQDAARRLVEEGATEIVVVPLLVSSYSGHYNQIRYLAGAQDTLSEMMQHHLHMSGIERPDVDVPIHLAKAIDNSPQVARVLADNALAIADDPASQALFIIGHGPNSAEAYAEWMINLRQVADSVEALTGFHDVKVGVVRDDAPADVRAEAVTRIREIIELQNEVTGKTVVVVPILVSSGSVSEVHVPEDLAGLPVEYSGQPLLPHPAMARWIEARVKGSE